MIRNFLEVPRIEKGRKTLFYGMISKRTENKQNMKIRLTEAILLF